MLFFSSPEKLESEREIFRSWEALTTDVKAQNPCTSVISAASFDFQRQRSSEIGEGLPATPTPSSFERTTRKLPFWISTLNPVW
jgi:hypothetical protein